MFVVDLGDVETRRLEVLQTDCWRDGWTACHTAAADQEDWRRWTVAVHDGVARERGARVTRFAFPDQSVSVTEHELPRNTARDLLEPGHALGYDTM